MKMGKGKRVREAKKRNVGKVGALNNYVVDSKGEYILTESGAKVYRDFTKHEFLEIPHIKDETGTGVVHTVLAVGVFPNGGGPCATIRTAHGPVVYRLSKELEGWARVLVGNALSGHKLLPDEVEFGFNEDEECYYADFVLEQAPAK